MQASTHDPGTRSDDAAHRRDANRAVGISAAGLALTGLAELLLATFTGSVALLGDAIHNLSDVSTSAVVFLGFRISRKPASRTSPAVTLFTLTRARSTAIRKAFPRQISSLH